MLLLLAAGLATAEEPPPPDFRIAITNLLVARYNPLGLEDQLRIGPQKRLYLNGKPLFRDNFVFFGLATRVSPAYIKIGPSLEIQPLSIFNLKFQVEAMSWFSTFNYFQSFNSPRADYSDTTIEKKDGITANGVHFIIEPTVMMKFGPIAFRNRLSLEYWRMSTRDPVFYDPTLDTLVPSNGWVLSNDLDVVYIWKKRVTAGVRYSVVEPFYSPGDYLPGEKTESDNGHQRLGPLFAYTFFDRPYTRFNKPSLIVILNWYVDHRWRTGADVNAGVPYVVVGFAFTSDLL